ncbi:hypothetical protein F2Q69_00014761 [Brassica cretica]|uniref:Pectinesterase catalytic domain-containing protein n=1 Tax=Brassica cretica TaxID=69181 RepID=A0A8S9QSM0_BRACR|nr:hypothetical protein F2Q69_00014761 [Brassica cretica]
MDSVASNLTGLLTSSLDMFVSAKPTRGETGGRKLLSGQDFPTWVSLSDRRLLEASVSELRPHAVVAAGGSGTHMGVGEALASLEKGTGGRSVIHLTDGTYKENLNIPTKQKNVMLVGDGKGKTVIVGSRSNKGGYNTYQTATVDLQISLLHHILYTGACDDGDLSHQDFRFEDWSCFSDGGDTFPSFLGGTQRKERGELTGVDMPHTHEKVHCSQEIIFAVEVGILGCVRHKNLLSARGYCAEGQERLIVYGYMPNLSLVLLLHSSQPLFD